MKVLFDINAKGNEKMLERIMGILDTSEFVTLAQRIALPSKVYYKITVKGDETLTDEYGDAIEAADDVVTLVKTNTYLEDEKAGLDYAIRNGHASRADVKAKRVTVESATRSEYSLDKFGYDMGDTKRVYSIIDTSGRCSVIGSFTTQLVFSDTEVVVGDDTISKTAKDHILEYAVKKGILQEVNLQSDIIDVVVKVVEEEEA